MKSKKILLLMFILIIPITVALPQFSTEFYGTGLYYNDNISVGQTVSAYYNNATFCGSFTVENTGFYGLLTCLADDPETVGVEGANSTSNITFRINGIDTHIVGDNLFESGEFKFVNISAPPLQCGDGFCDETFEGCLLCVDDCGACPDTNATGNATDGNETTGGNSSSSSSTSSGGAGGAGGTGGVGGTATDTGSTTSTTSGDIPVGEGTYCNENWECTPWGECSILNVQTRDCYDLNGCSSTANRPDEEQACDYLAHCNDGIRNFDETGIDCGGSCGPCDQCFNGIQDSDEEGIDCGGPCVACTSCFDGKQNQGEQGIDCGGPCDAQCPEVIQRPGYICTKSLSPFNQWFLLIVVIVLLSNVFVYMGYYARIKQIRKQKIDSFKKARKIYQLKKKIFTYIISTVVISALLLLYYWFLGVCEELNVRYLWVLAILLVLSFFIINYIIRMMEFNEKKKLSVMQLLENSHYKRLEKIIAFHKKRLNELMEEINRLILILMKDKEFQYVLETESEFKIMYKDLIKMYLEKAKKDAFSQEEEKQDIEEIKKITESEKFKESMKKHPKFDALVRRIELLIKQYDDLSKAELEKAELEKKTEETVNEEVEKKEENDEGEKKEDK